MRKREIVFKTVYDPVLEEKILSVLMSTDFDNFTLANISRALGNKYRDGTSGWEKLRLHLLDMVKRKLIEERHFDTDAGDWKGIVDYSIENKGIKKYKERTPVNSSRRGG